MAASPHTFIGIDPTPRYDPFVYAALDDELHLMAIGKGRLADVIAYAAGQSAALIGINAPQKLNQGLVNQAEERQHLFPVPPNKRGNLRQAELTLLVQGVHVPRTPAQEKYCPVWMKNGFLLYQHLLSMGYRLFPADESPRQIMEVQAEAAFFALLGKAPLFELNSLEGRLQRQLALYDKKIQLSDPMDFFEEVTRFRLLRGILPAENIYSGGELNALVCAFTAWLSVHAPERLVQYGVAEEGFIYLPALEDTNLP